MPDTHPIHPRDALLFWLKLGFISFGGPVGQIAIMHRELVEKRRWISEGRFLHALNYCMLLPGPEAQQLATYMGWLINGTRGALIAGLLFLLPSLVLMVGLSWVYVRFGHLPLVAGVLWGVKPAVVAIVVQAIHRIGSRTLKSRLLWAIALGAFLAMAWAKLPFPLIIVLAGAIGFLAARLARRWQPSAPPAKADMAPRVTRGRVWRVAILGAALWGLPMMSLALLLGPDHTLTQMGWFFTKAALLTFGGAYAVLPYVYQGAVVQHGWLSGAQMIDGLALGETTPGPLIMVVAFAGFVGGHGLALFGVEHRVAAGLAAALVVAYFTFLPSFVFILAGAPVVESTQRMPALTGPLSAVAAAVVGVMGTLAVFFSQHVLWVQGQLDGAACALAVLAAIALMVWRRGVVEVILVAAVVGALWRGVGG